MKYVLYHADCNDGFGAALVVWLEEGDMDHAYVPVRYGEPMPEMPDASQVWILDFSYPRAELDALAERLARVNHTDVGTVARTRLLWVVDHHATAERELARRSYALFDQQHSAAILTWSHIHGEPAAHAPRFLHYIEDRDMWWWELPESRAFSAGLGSYPREFVIWRPFLCLGTDRLIEAGWHILRAVRQSVERQVQRQQSLRLFFSIGASAIKHQDTPYSSAPVKDEVTVPCVNATEHISEVGEELLRQHPSARFSVSWCVRGDGKRVYSLRSRQDEDVDVGEIATAFGGGGHKHAAGFVR